MCKGVRNLFLEFYFIFIQAPHKGAESTHKFDILASGFCCVLECVLFNKKGKHSHIQLLRIFSEHFPNMRVPHFIIVVVAVDFFRVLRSSRSPNTDAKNYYQFLLFYPYVLHHQVLLPSRI